MKTVTQRIIDEEKVSAEEILECKEIPVKNALHVMNNSCMSPDYLDETARKIYEVIKDRKDLVTEIH
jgi:hypothetical protein